MQDSKVTTLESAKPIKEGFFLKRPVFSTVISIFFVLLGLLSIRVLPIAQYPDLVPPMVQVSASYPGASPETIAQTVASPLEVAINGVENMIYMNSVSSVNGSMSLNVYFEIGTDPDQATINVNNKVQAALTGLPETVRRYGVTVTKSSPSFLQIVTISAPSGMYDDIFLSNYTLINIVDSIKRINGVGSASILGAKDYAIRIWLNPYRMAQLGITPTDIASAVQDQNAQYAAGSIGSLPTASDTQMMWQINSLGRLITPEEFGNIILRTDESLGVLRIRDVARVELGAAMYDFGAKLNGVNTIPITITLAPGANALATADAVIQTMESLKASFPFGVEYSIPYDTTTFVRVSIEEVVKTLGEAMFLVFLVVFLFLQNWRATLIPCLAVPISIVGAFAGMEVLGFSINTLTLFGLVLAIGIVVDDAIVVLENVERILQTEDLTPRQATAKAMGEVTAPVVTIVLVLCAVFIPVAFLGGLAGEMYKQFAITIAISVTLSGIVALTLTPSLCVLLLKKEHRQPHAFFRAFNRVFDSITNGFTGGVKKLIRSNLLSLCIFGAIFLVVGRLFLVLPTSLVPDEDQGAIMCVVALPDGASLLQTEEVMASVSKDIQAIPGVKDVLALSGFDLISMSVISNKGAMFIILEDWSIRTEKGIGLREIITQVYGLGLKQAKGLVLPFNPPPIMGMSTTGGFEMMIQSTSGNVKELADVTQNFIAEAQKRPELSSVSSTYSVSAPRMFIDLDREKARVLNVRVSDVFNTLGATLGATYINDFNMEGRSFRVFMQADQQYRSVPEDIRSLYVRSTDGKEIPILSLVTTQIDGGPSALERFNGFTSAKITGNPGSGYSSGQAIAALEEVAKSVLPTGYTYAWTGTTYQEVVTGGTNYSIFILSLLMVFLILAAQYERWTLPLVVLTAVPFALFGALLANWLLGLDNDVYTQVAMITLLGLASKNAILIVEFAADLQKQGMGRVEAAIEAARLRFRPIVMTSIAFILGCVPLALSSGAGAASRVTIGISVIGGMLAATILAPLLVPYFYAKVVGLGERFSRKDPEHTPENPAQKEDHA